MKEDLSGLIWFHGDRESSKDGFSGTEFSKMCWWRVSQAAVIFCVSSILLEGKLGKRGGRLSNIVGEERRGRSE